MKNLLSLKTMINRQVFSFLKNVLVFLIDRLYKEWGYILGNGRIYCEKASERGDLYTKQLIENIIHDRSSKYDPYKLNGNAMISYGTTSVILGKAHVTGLSSLRRTNICSLTEEGNRLFIIANLGAGPLTYQRQVVIKFGGFERKADILVTLSNIKVSVDFSVEKETGRNGFLLKCAIDELSGFKLSVNGFGYFEWALNLVFSFWTLVLKRIIRNLLENELEQYILKRLPKYQFPVEGTSYRNETIFNQPEGSQNSEASLSESFLKQSHKTPKWSRFAPTDKNGVYDGHNSVEYETEKELGSKPDIAKNSRYSPETNKWATEMKTFYLPARSLDLCCGFLNKDSCHKVLKEKSEDKGDLISELSRKTRELFRSLNIVTEKLDTIQDITNSLSKKTTLKNCLNVLDDCSRFDRNIQRDLNATDEVDFKISESEDSATSSPATDLEKEQSFLICDRQGKVKKSKKDLSKMSRVSYRDQIERASEAVKENFEQSKLLEEIFSEINERSCKKNIDGNAFEVGIELPARIANYDSSPLTKLESSQINENILEPSITETATHLSQTLNLDSERRKVQIDYLEKMFNGKNRKERSGVLSKNKVSAESYYCGQYSDENFSAGNLDLKLSGTEMLQNESIISCTVDEFEKHLKVFSNVFSREHESKIEDPEPMKSNEIEKLSRNQGVEMLEIRCISSPEDEVDGQNYLASNITSDSVQQRIQDSKSSDLEVDVETVTTSLQFSEKYENKVNEKIPFKYVKVNTGEIELERDQDSKLKADEGYSEDDSSNSEGCNFSFGFSEQSSGLYNEPFQNNPCNLVSKDETGEKCDNFSVLPRDSLEISRSSKVMKRKLDSWYQETSQVEDPACLNKRECTHSVAEFSSLEGLKLNVNSCKNSLEDSSNQKTLHDLLQEEIIAKTRKLVSGVELESDQEGNEYSGSIPTLNCKDLEYPKDELICNEDNRFLRRDSETDQEVVSLLTGDCPSISETELSSLEETYSDIESPSESDTGTSTETSSETENEPEHEM